MYTLPEARDPSSLTSLSALLELLWFLKRVEPTGLTIRPQEVAPHDVQPKVSTTSSLFRLCTSSKSPYNYSDIVWSTRKLKVFVLKQLGLTLSRVWSNNTKIADQNGGPEAQQGWDDVMMMHRGGHWLIRMIVRKTQFLNLAMLQLTRGLEYLLLASFRGRRAGKKDSSSGWVLRQCEQVSATQTVHSKH